ncbi:hypothetical protein ABE571_04505 [Stenotrophomonas sp. TWI273]|jgi:hypothetical protein|nr:MULTISPECIES: hypothetical protein [Stenotrophomonas]
MGSFSIYHWIIIVGLMLIPVAIAAVIAIVVLSLRKKPPNR